MSPEESQVALKTAVIAVFQVTHPALRSWRFHPSRHLSLTCAVGRLLRTEWLNLRRGIRTGAAHQVCPLSRELMSEVRELKTLHKTSTVETSCETLFQWETVGPTLPCDDDVSLCVACDCHAVARQRHYIAPLLWCLISQGSLCWLCA